MGRNSPGPGWGGEFAYELPTTVKGTYQVLITTKGVTSGENRGAFTSVTRSERTIVSYEKSPLPSHNATLLAMFGLGALELR